MQVDHLHVGGKKRRFLYNRKSVAFETNANILTDSSLPHEATFWGVLKEKSPECPKIFLCDFRADARVRSTTHSPPCHAGLVHYSPSFTYAQSGMYTFISTSSLIKHLCACIGPSEEARQSPFQQRCFKCWGGSSNSAMNHGMSQPAGRQQWEMEKCRHWEMDAIH